MQSRKEGGFVFPKTLPRDDEGSMGSEKGKREIALDEPSVPGKQRLPFSTIRGEVQGRPEESILSRQSHSY
jgi:hypothetical protein